MPAPSTSLATLRPDLGGALEEYSLEADRLGFVGLKVLPEFDAPEQTGTFGVIPVEQLLKTVDTRRAPKSGYSRDDFEFTAANYATVEHGREEVVDDRQAKLYRNYFDAELIASRRARDKVLRAGEIRVAGMLQDTGTLSNAAATQPWTDHSNSHPLADIEAALLAIYNRCGLWANTVVIPLLTFRHLRFNAEVIDRLNSNGVRDTAPDKITAAMIAMVFDVKSVIVAGGTKNTANEAKDAVFANIWDKSKILVARVAETNDIEEPCLGRTFHWSEDGSDIGCTMESYREESKRGDVVRARYDVGEKLILPEAGQLITSVNNA